MEHPGSVIKIVRKFWKTYKSIQLDWFQWTFGQLSYFVLALRRLARLRYHWPKRRSEDDLSYRIADPGAAHRRLKYGDQNIVFNRCVDITGVKPTVILRASQVWRTQKKIYCRNEQNYVGRTKLSPQNSTFGWNSLLGRIAAEEPRCAHNSQLYSVR